MNKHLHPFHSTLRWLALIATLGLAGCGAETPQSLLEAGKASIAKGDYKAAAVQFKGALQKDPQSADIRVLLGQALLSSGDPAGAAVELNKALEQKADRDTVVPLLARAALLAGDNRKVAMTYGQVQLGGKSAQAALKTVVASAWGAAGEEAKADASLDAALALAPDSAEALVLRARQLARRQDMKGATEAIDKALASNPKSPEAWVIRGELTSLGQNDGKAAEASYRKALEFAKDYLPAHAALIGSRLRAKDVAGAKAQLGEFVAALPKHPMRLLFEAQIALSEDKLGTARERIQTLMPQAPRNLAVLQMAGIVAYLNGELAQAETHFTKALEIDPSQALARRGLADVYSRLGQPNKTLAVLKPMIGEESENADALGLAGQASIAMGDPEGAERYFARAAKIAPDDTRIEASLALNRIARADPATGIAELTSLASKSKDIVAELALFGARMKRREFDAALAAVDQIAKKQPNNPVVYELRGQAHLARRDRAGAREAFEQLLKVDPLRFAATANLAALDVLDHKPDEARKRLQASIEADPHNPYALLAMAALQEQSGATADEIKKLISAAVQVAPQVPGPRLELIALTLRKRQYKEALIAAQEALAAMPGDLHVMDAVGRAQMDAGDVEQAISTFRKMAGIDTNSGLAYSRLADIYRRIGKKDQAEAVLRKALEIEPELATAQTALLELLIGAKRAPEALAFAKQAQKNAPSKAFGYALEADYHLRLKALGAAATAYEAGVKKTGNATLALSLHRLLLRMGHGDEADRFGVNWLKDHPDDASFEYQLAESDMGRGRYAQAESRLTRLIAHYPESTLALNNLALLLVRSGKPGAVGAAQKAVDLAPDTPALLDTLAAAQAAEKQVDKALVTQKRVVELAPDATGYRFRLASLAIQAGDKALARAELERLRAMGSKFGLQDDVASMLKSL